VDAAKLDLRGSALVAKHPRSGDSNRFRELGNIEKAERIVGRGSALLIIYLA